MKHDKFIIFIYILTNFSFVYPIKREMLYCTDDSLASYNCVHIHGIINKARTSFDQLMFSVKATLVL